MVVLPPRIPRLTLSRSDVTTSPTPRVLLPLSVSIAEGRNAFSSGTKAVSLRPDELCGYVSRSAVSARGIEGAFALVCLALDLPNGWQRFTRRCHDPPQPYKLPKRWRVNSRRELLIPRSCGLLRPARPSARHCGAWSSNRT